ncbi:MAG TPA: ABC transporter substrate-binding protein [Burkholderiaceae bacterium]|nr:ABC transporter substrate-binding protein [Burkholderiaceae bacterium]
MRREFLRRTTGLLAVPTVAQMLPAAARAAIGDTLTIAYHVAPPGWDPNTGPYAVNPGIQTIFRTIYDPFIVQKPDLSLAPGICEEFAWNADKSAITLKVRRGAAWHDGKPVTAEDVAWNLRRIGDPTAGNPLAPIFASNKNITVQGDLVKFDVNPFRTTMLERLTFLACYLIPPHYYQEVGKAGFEQKPIGSGPYLFDQYERGSFLRLKANPNYWGGKPEFATVVFKFVTDASSRVAEIERGSSDLTLELPYEEYDRLKKKPGLAGNASPVTDIAMIFFNSVGPMSDPNVRKAAVHAIDKNLIATRLHRGYVKPIDTLLAPQYKGFSDSIRTPYDPKLATALLAKSGFSPAKPVEFTVQTTRGYKPKDYETIQAITEMWRRVGIKASIEVYEIAKHFELRTQHKLAPAAFYNWGNATADPESSLVTAMLSSSPHSSWKTPDMDEQLKPLVNEKDDVKRFEAYRKVNAYIAENAYVLPLFQFYQPVVYKSDLDFKPHLAGFVLPAELKRKRR